MADCRFCRTRITTTRSLWVHVDPEAPDDCTPEPPLDDSWHDSRKGVGRLERDEYGPRWPQGRAKVQIDSDFYERAEDHKPPQRRTGRRRGRTQR